VFSFRPKNAAKPEIKKEVPTTDFRPEKEAKKEAVINVSTTNNASELVEYAKTLTGTPYLYGSVDPAKGFDCSGFINHVSNHFGIKVPRSSVEFTNFGTTVNTTDAMPGDFILFTGTDPGKQVVGHIGIITDNTDGEVEFIHSSSGKANGVTISELKGYYETRFVKVIRIFQSSEEKIFA
jgi:cell wall-associated NlpC family hydrolase